MLGQSFSRELPVEREQGLVAGIRQRTDRPLQPPAGTAGGWRVGWTFTPTRDTRLMGRGMALPTTPAVPGVKRWVDRVVCLSCDSCLL
jgi:hypothetical protein